MTADALLNATPWTVTYTDGSTAQIALRRLTIRQLYTFVDFAVAQKGPAIVALVCDQSEDWIDTLADESFAELLKEAVKRNFPRAMKIADSDPVMAVKIAPLLGNLALIELSARQLNAPPSPDSSPAPASLESAEAIGSASSTSLRSVSIS